MTQRSKICFFTGTLSVFAGAERVTAVLASELATQGFEVHIVCQYGTSSVFELHPNIQLHALYAKRPSFKTHYLATIHRLRTYLKAQGIQVLIDVDPNLVWFSLPARTRLNIRHIAWEHTHFHQDLGLYARRIARQLAARFCQAIVVLTERDCQAWVQALPHLNSESADRCHTRIVAIANPLTVKRPGLLPENRPKRVLAVGRLEHVKGFDLLLTAWSLLQPLAPEWQLRIVGDGSQRPSLEAQRAELGLDHSVEILPATADIAAQYADAKIFALSSRYEGLPLVVMEAMAWGLAVVAFDCETGPRELIANKQTGLLVAPENPQELSQTLLDLMQDTHFLNKLSAQALEHSHRYDPKNIVKQWLTLIGN